MSIGLLSNIGGSVAGSSLAQIRGSDVDRAQQEQTARELRAQSDEKAELAAGVGQTDGDEHQTAERDADGRQVWQLRRRGALAQRVDEADADGGPPPENRVKDPTGQSGNMLDLSG
jgi:hypothetical protein